MGKVTCAVQGCSNSVYRLIRWKQTFCETHQVVHGDQRCICAPPFKLIPFPTELSNVTDRNIWIQNIRRFEVADREVKEKTSRGFYVVKFYKGDIWKPASYDRVCSKHFPDGAPTPENPHPVLNMGHKHALIRKRNNPIIGPPSIPLRKRNKVTTSTLSTPLNSGVTTNKKITATLSTPLNSGITTNKKITTTPSTSLNSGISSNDSFNENMHHSYCYSGDNNFNGCYQKQMVNTDSFNESVRHSYCYSEGSDCKGCYQKQMVINKLIERVTELEENLEEEKKKHAVKKSIESQFYPTVQERAATSHGDVVQPKEHILKKSIESPFNSTTSHLNCKKKKRPAKVFIIKPHSYNGLNI